MNLSIPDAAAELSVSETRLRRTLLENAVPTLVEFRQTRTGVRKTTVLTEAGIGQLRALFTQPLPDAVTSPLPIDYPAVREESQTYEFHPPCEDPIVSERAFTEEVSTVSHAAPVTAQSVPITQFNALLYQHNVLREELTRVTEYLDGCDRLLGEMVRTIATLEERTRQLDLAPSPARRMANPLSGALRSVSATVQNALFSKTPAKPIMKPSEVYYSNVLAGR